MRRGLSFHLEFIRIATSEVIGRRRDVGVGAHYTLRVGDSSTDAFLLLEAEGAVRVKERIHVGVLDDIDYEIDLLLWDAVLQ